MLANGPQALIQSLSSIPFVIEPTFAQLPQLVRDHFSNTPNTRKKAITFAKSLIDQLKKDPGERSQLIQAAHILYTCILPRIDKVDFLSNQLLHTLWHKVSQNFLRKTACLAKGEVSLGQNHQVLSQMHHDKALLDHYYPTFNVVTQEMLDPKTESTDPAVAAIQSDAWNTFYSFAAVECDFGMISQSQNNLELSNTALHNAKEHFAFLAKNSANILKCANISSNKAKVEEAKKQFDVLKGNIQYLDQLCQRAQVRPNRLFNAVAALEINCTGFLNNPLPQTNPTQAQAVPSLLSILTKAVSFSTLPERFQIVKENKSLTITKLFLEEIKACTDKKQVLNKLTQFATVCTLWARLFTTNDNDLTERIIIEKFENMAHLCEKYVKEHPVLKAVSKKKSSRRKKKNAPALAPSAMPEPVLETKQEESELRALIGDLDNLHLDSAYEEAPRAAVAVPPISTAKAAAFIDPAWVTEHTVKHAEETKAILNTLTEAGFFAYVVGGFVRNSLLKRSVGDVDIVTNCPWQTLRQVLPQLLSAPYEHNPNFPQAYMLKTLNIDIYCTEHSLEEDAKNRAITINAFYSDSDGRVLDPLGNINDIHSEYLNVTQSPDIVFSEYPHTLLILVHLAHNVDKKIPKELISAMQRNANRITSMPLAVYLRCLERLFLSERAPENIAFLKEHNLLQHLLPFPCNASDLAALDKDHDKGVHVLACLLKPFAQSKSKEETISAFLESFKGQANIDEKRLLEKRLCSLLKPPAQAVTPLYLSLTQKNIGIDSIPNFVPRDESKKAFVVLV